MPTPLSIDQVHAMAPDASSLKAANGLANNSKWLTLGVDAQALWGECKGSGSKPYQTQIELSSKTARCSCPSRKFPCKHSLALLLLYAQQASRLTSESPCPQWVTDWIEDRQKRAAKKEEKTASVAADPVKQAANAAKRQNTRWKRIEDGAQELQRWITDIFQRGFAKFDYQQYSQWEEMAARMVDAQAPGLANEIKNILELLSSGQENQQYAIEQLGLLQVLVSATLRKDELSANRQADVRTALGWAFDKDEVLSTATPITDHWFVLGQVMQEVDARLTSRHIWLYGKKSKQYALLLDFAFQGQGLEWSWDLYKYYEATLAYYPASTPLRALVVEQKEPLEDLSWPQMTLAESMDKSSALLAANPWLRPVPLFLPQAQILQYKESWGIKVDQNFFPLQANESAVWTLMAFSGCEPFTLFGQWDKATLLPVSMYSPHKPKTMCSLTATI